MNNAISDLTYVLLVIIVIVGLILFAVATTLRIAQEIRKEASKSDVKIVRIYKKGGK